jgi:hypothetical protein
MCVSSNPSVMSNTRLYAGEAEVEGKYAHVLAYQNKAQTRGPNAMILPLPARGDLGPKNMLDTREYRGFLDDISEATRHVTRGSRSMKSSYGIAQRAQVFDVGSYTVVLAKSPDEVPEALALVPEAKRPTISQEMLDSFAQNYPSWPLAVCCWDGTIDAEPLLWWYEPRVPEVLFAPALDAHDGRAPDLHRQVDVDHNLSFGSTLRTLPGASTVRYTSMAALGSTLLPKAVVGTKLVRTMQNGDFLLGVGSPGPAMRVTPRSADASATVALKGWS